MRTLVWSISVFMFAATVGAIAVDRYGEADACPPAYEPAPEANVSGAFDSNFGLVYLEQRGARITGRYECCGGGTLTGYMRGDTITFTWHQPGATGQGVWRFERATDGREGLAGTWGWDASRESGGAWNLQRSAVRVVAVAQ